MDAEIAKLRVEGDAFVADFQKTHEICGYQQYRLSAYHVLALIAERRALLDALEAKLEAKHPSWPIGTFVMKAKGAQWRGHIVGYYSTALTPIGYCVESIMEPGSVQIYPQAALILAQPAKEPI